MMLYAETKKHPDKEAIRDFKLPSSDEVIQVTTPS
jgi:hypothetical protein